MIECRQHQAAAWISLSILLHCPVLGSLAKADPAHDRLNRFGGRPGSPHRAQRFAPPVGTGSPKQGGPGHWPGFRARLLGEHLIQADGLPDAIAQRAPGAVVAQSLRERSVSALFPSKERNLVVAIHAV